MCFGEYFLQPLSNLLVVEFLYCILVPSKQLPLKQIFSAQPSLHVQLIGSAYIHIDWFHHTSIYIQIMDSCFLFTEGNEHLPYYVHSHILTSYMFLNNSPYCTVTSICTKYIQSNILYICTRFIYKYNTEMSSTYPQVCFSSIWHVQNMDVLQLLCKSSTFLRVDHSRR